MPAFAHLLCIFLCLPGAWHGAPAPCPPAPAFTSLRAHSPRYTHTRACSIPELEFEIGAGAYVPFAGDLTTVADVLMQACKNLNMNQVGRAEALGGMGCGADFTAQRHARHRLAQAQLLSTGTRDPAWVCASEAGRQPRASGALLCGCPGCRQSGAQRTPTPPERLTTSSWCGSEGVQSIGAMLQVQHCNAQQCPLQRAHDSVPVIFLR